MAKMKTDTAVVTGKVRLSFVNLFKPKAINEGDEPKYSVLLLIPKTDTETIDFIRRAQKNAIAAKWGDKKPKKITQTLRDGDEEGPDDRPEYEGHYFMNVSSKYQPQLFTRGTGADGKPLPLEREDELYSGCYAQVSINAYCFDVNGNKGVTFGINGCRKVADGESLGGRVDTSDDYDNDIVEDEDDDLIL